MNREEFAKRYNRKFLVFRIIGVLILGGFCANFAEEIDDGCWLLSVGYGTKNI